MQGYSDPTMDELIDQGIRISDGPARANIYNQIQQRVIEECPSVALETLVDRHFERTWICGWYYNPLSHGMAGPTSLPRNFGNCPANTWKWYYTPHAQQDAAGNDTSNSLPYDVNYDGRTNMIDIGTAAASFGGSYGVETPISSKWNFRCDFNNDRRIDMKDIAGVAKNFGRTSAIWTPSY